jgi:hypothetical protein
VIHDILDAKIVRPDRVATDPVIQLNALADAWHKFRFIIGFISDLIYDSKGLHAGSLSNLQHGAKEGRGRLPAPTQGRAWSGFQKRRKHGNRGNSINQTWA